MGFCNFVKNNFYSLFHDRGNNIMDRTLTNKVAVITGGADGIGYAIATHFLEHAKVVVILDINEDKGAEAVRNLNSRFGGGKAVYIKCDITKDLETVSRKIFETYKQVDVLVNNAGIADESSARKTLELNTIALIEWSMKFWEHMRKDKGGNGGTIINIGSIYSFSVDPYAVYYKASKFAVQGFTRSLGHEQNYKKFGVRMIVIAPGFTYTKLADQGGCWDEHLEDLEEFIKTQKWQDAEEVGKAAVAVFQSGDSGSMWQIVGGELAEVHVYVKL